MKTGVLNSKLEMLECPYYELQGLMENIVSTATTYDKTGRMQEKFEKYQTEITRFSPELEFCLHELGWMLYDPFLEGKDEVLFSNGNRCYLVSREYVLKKGFNRHDIDADMGYPILTDRNVSYDPTVDPNKVIEGIIDSKGYVDSGFADSIETLGEIVLMEEMIKNKELYLYYMRNKDNFENMYKFVTSLKNVISVNRLEDGKISIQYVSENDGIVQEFIDNVAEQGLLANLVPITQEGDMELVAVKEEDYPIMKAA